MSGFQKLRDLLEAGTLVDLGPVPNPALAMVTSATALADFKVKILPGLGRTHVRIKARDEKHAREIIKRNYPGAEIHSVEKI